MIHMNFILFFKQMVSFMKSVDMYLLKTEGIARGRISAKDSSRFPNLPTEIYMIN